MTKSKSSMVTRGITHLATDTLPVLVIQSVFSLLPLSRYPLPITTPSRYQPTDSSGKLLYTTVSRNVTFVRCRMSLVTILLLDLVMIHWIRWIQRWSFRENSNGSVHTCSVQNSQNSPKRAHFCLSCENALKIRSGRNWNCCIDYIKQELHKLILNVRNSVLIST